MTGLVQWAQKTSYRDVSSQRLTHDALSVSTALHNLHMWLPFSVRRTQQFSIFLPPMFIFYGLHLSLLFLQPRLPHRGPFCSQGGRCIQRGKALKTDGRIHQTFTTADIAMNCASFATVHPPRLEGPVHGRYCPIVKPQRNHALQVFAAERIINMISSDRELYGELQKYCSTLQEKKFKPVVGI